MQMSLLLIFNIYCLYLFHIKIRYFLRNSSDIIVTNQELNTQESDNCK